MRDTDWRPSPCPLCGELRAAAKHPVCSNPKCEYKSMKNTKTNSGRYLWIRPNSAEAPMTIIDDPVELFRGPQFDESVDKLYKIGPEVKLKVSVEPVPSYRLGEDKMKTVQTISSYRTTFENRD